MKQYRIVKVCEKDVWLGRSDEIIGTIFTPNGGSNLENLKNSEATYVHGSREDGTFLCLRHVILVELSSSIELPQYGESLASGVSEASRRCENIFPLKEKKTMKTVKTVHMIDGRNTVDMSKTEMIDMIANEEATIAKLEAVDTESTAITKEIAKRQQFIKDVVAHLDAKK